MTAVPTSATGGVSRTAVIVAQARATESAREDRLFDDPLAQAFVDVVGWVQVAQAGRLNQGHFVLRTRFFDDYLRAAWESGCGQAVIVASGLDARAYRLDWPAGFPVFEIDLPGLLAFKDAVIGVRGARPSCARVAVPADLRRDWATALREAGHDPAVPTAWLIEGLLMYLDAPSGDAILATVGHLSAPGSRLGIEHVNRAYLDLPQIQEVQRRLRQFSATWRSTCEDPVAWLAAHGWTATVIHQADLAARHNRPVPELTTAGDARMWLVTADRP